MTTLHISEITEIFAFALCKGMGSNIFYENTGRYASREAKAICKECPIKQPCLEYALAHGEDGVWGGTTEKERRRLRRAELQVSYQEDDT